jgi:hypothetical protein
MAIVYKVLGQSNPSATTNTTLYTVPAGNSAVCSTLTVCNLSGTTANFRIAIRPAGATISNQHYINYDTQVPGNDSIAITIGLSLAATDVVTVFSNTATVAFSLFGSEID